jgi:hypothetical protein
MASQKPRRQPSVTFSDLDEHSDDERGGGRAAERPAPSKAAPAAPGRGKPGQKQQPVEEEEEEDDDDDEEEARRNTRAVALAGGRRPRGTTDTLARRPTQVDTCQTSFNRWYESQSHGFKLIIRRAPAQPSRPARCVV